jgi:uncharacterized protein YlxP (DUF503 family)
MSAPTIGVITFQLAMPDAHSLKDKRHWVKGLKDRLRARCNVAVAEIAFQESHKQGLVAAVTVSGIAAERNRCCRPRNARLRRCSADCWWM